MRTLIKGGELINPAGGYHQIADLLMEDGKIVRIGHLPEEIQAADHVIDAAGLLVVPGLIDIHVHFREPGYPDKETIASGSLAAAAGGFTSVVCMPNTKPAIDTAETLTSVLEEGRKSAVVHVYSSAAITRGIQGEQLTDMEALFHAGAVTFTDDGRTVVDSSIIYEAFVTAARLGVPISSHCEDHRLVTAGAINRGEISRRLGDPGISPLGEELMIARDLLLAEETGARLHIQHVSTARGVQLIREAKRRGVHVTAEGAPHHFSITDEKVLEFGALAKVNPPLRTAQDVEAVASGLADGTLDVIATDHAPHTAAEKRLPLAQAPFGMVGLETCVGLTFTHLVHTGKLSVDAAVAKLTIEPAQIMSLPGGTLSEGANADVTLIDPNKEWVVEPEAFHSKSTNCPFAGMKLRGKAVATFVSGQCVYKEAR
ncbi:dihydroorotase [Paenibacillus senegalensis]|uniref:dihydroorotase n=1 Tax=Paenibacillus senegalensis TaxID=1465766 RepID=UPI0002880FA1|nr:dihydroorotase [Paenibacillus senegalensis]